MPLQKRRVNASSTTQELARMNIELQKITVELIEKMNNFTTRIDRMLSLFEDAARHISTTDDTSRLKTQLQELLDQNKTIVRGLLSIKRYLHEQQPTPLSAFQLKPSKVQSLPIDETLPFTPDSFTQYKLPLSQGISKAQNNQQFTPPLPPLQQTSPIAVTVPPEAEPPITLIVDAESKKPIVTVAIQNDVYTVTEPPLSSEEINMIGWLRENFIGKEKKLADKEKLNKKIWKAAKKMNYTMQKNDDDEYLKMKYYLVKHLVQLGWIEPLLHDDAVTKITCEGENIPLTIVRKNKTLKTNITCPSVHHINHFLRKFAERAYKKVSEKNPVVDVIANGYHLEGSLKTATTPARFVMTKVA